jgi:hypothetical protein
MLLFGERLVIVSKGQRRISHIARRSPLARRIAIANHVHVHTHTHRHTPSPQKQPHKETQAKSTSPMFQIHKHKHKYTSQIRQRVAHPATRKFNENYSPMLSVRRTMIIDARFFPDARSCSSASRRVYSAAFLLDYPCHNRMWSNLLRSRSPNVHLMSFHSSAVFIQMLPE